MSRVSINGNDVLQRQSVRNELNNDIELFLANGGAVDKQKIIRRSDEELLVKTEKHSLSLTDLKKKNQKKKIKESEKERIKSLRRLAKLNGEDEYMGSRCRNGHFKRFVKSNKCVECNK